MACGLIPFFAALSGLRRVLFKLKLHDPFDHFRGRRDLPTLALFGERAMPATMATAERSNQPIYVLALSDAFHDEKVVSRLPLPMMTNFLRRSRRLHVLVIDQPKIRFGSQGVLFA